MPINHPNKLELHQRMSLQFKSQSRIINIVFILLAICLVAILVLATKPSNISEWFDSMPKIWELMADGFARNPMRGALNLFFLAAVIIHQIYMYRAVRMERLILTREGIEYRSPLPAILQFIRPEWSLSWKQIRAIKLENPRFGTGIQMVTLRLDDGIRPIKIYPWHWVDPEDFKPTTPWRELRTQQKMSLLDKVLEIEESQLLRYIKAALPQLEIDNSAKFTEPFFSLENNLSSLTIVISFFALVLYAFMDGMILGKETYAAAAPLNWFVLIGILSASISAWWMLRSGVPKLEGILVALLLGGAAGAASYPGVLRINAFTDTEGLRTYEYVLQSDLTMIPIDHGLPNLAFPGHADYWQQYQTGSTHQFDLRYGGLGFYQINMEPTHNKWRKYYKDKHKR